MRSLLFMLAFTFVTQVATAQEKEKIQELETQKELRQARQVNARLDSAVRFLDDGEYEQADARFRYVFANMKSIPSDLAYHFGKNSYHLGKYKQSVDWLTKYIQLKGTSGQFSKDAAAWLKKAEEALVVQRQSESAKVAQVLSRDYTIDCGPSAKVVCPVCNGSTVVVRKDYFGDKYSTCTYCNKLGYLSCDDYNKLLRGQLKPSTENK